MTPPPKDPAEWLAEIEQLVRSATSVPIPMEPQTVLVLVALVREWSDGSYDETKQAVFKLAWEKVHGQTG